MLVPSECGLQSCLSSAGNMCVCTLEKVDTLAVQHTAADLGAILAAEKVSNCLELRRGLLLGDEVVVTYALPGGVSIRSCAMELTVRPALTLRQMERALYTA